MSKDLSDFGFDLFRLGSKNLGAIAAYRDLPREPSSIIPSAWKGVWFEGYDEAAARGSLRGLVVRLQSTREKSS